MPGLAKEISVNSFDGPFLPDIQAQGSERWVHRLRHYSQMKLKYYRKRVGKTMYNVFSIAPVVTDFSGSFFHVMFGFGILVVWNSILFIEYEYFKQLRAIHIDFLFNWIAHSFSGKLHCFSSILSMFLFNFICYYEVLKICHQKCLLQVCKSSSLFFLLSKINMFALEKGLRHKTGKTHN